MKKWFLPLLVAMVLVSSIVFPYEGNAQLSKEEINRQLKEIEKQRQQAEQEAAMAKKQMTQIQYERAAVVSDLKEINYSVQEAEAEINYLRNEIEKVAQRMMELDVQIEQTNAELNQTIEELEAAEERVEARDDLLKARVRLMYTNGFVSYLDVLLSSTDFSDFLDRYNALTSIVNQDKEILEANERDRDLIVLKKQEKELRQQELELVFAQKEIIKQNLMYKEEDKEVLISSLSMQQQSLAQKEHELHSKEEALEQISEEQEKLLIQLASRKSALEAEKNGEVTPTNGKFGYPLPKTYPLTSNFGYRIDPITGAKGAYHKGMDFGAPGGTDILAAETGKVIVAQWWGGYGNCVIIDHGGGIWTLYAHMKSNSMTVSEGDIVTRGDKIGEVGTTGRSTGNHLHFEVRKNEVAVNPKDYIN